MENVQGLDQRAQIINELLQGLESVKQLQKQITNNKTNLSSLCDDDQTLNYSFLIEKMTSTFDKTINIAKQINPSNPKNYAHLELSPHSFDVTSPPSENSQHDLPPFKRRKSMPKWTKTVKISPDKSVSGLEGPLNDGFSWRKYGQKGIFGARFPRGYYRCTHRHTKNCTATKQVQQSDEDPSIYQVMYRGEHTCHPGPNKDLAQAQIKPTLPLQIKYQEQSPQSPQQEIPISQETIQEVYLGLDPEGDLKFEPNVSDNKAQIFRCFSFNSTLPETELLDNYILDYSTTTTSDSNYFPESPYEVIVPSVGLNVQTPETDMNDSSSCHSPMMDYEFELLGQWLDIDPNLF